MASRLCSSAGLERERLKTGDMSLPGLEGLPIRNADGEDPWNLDLVDEA